MKGEICMITLEKITKENIRDCVRLEVAESQKEFVAKNVNTIAWAYVDQQFTPYAICAGDEVVGLLAVEDIPDNEEYDRYWVPRFMIGEAFQGKGYGKAAMKAVINMLSAKPECQRIRLSVWPENTYAIEFYKNIGFVETEEWLEDERVLDYFVKIE
jgi:diamine N-acetyltransferase